MRRGKFGGTFPGWVMIQPLATVLMIFLGAGFVFGRVEDGDDKFWEVKYNIWKLVSTIKSAKHHEASSLIDWSDYCHKDGPLLGGRSCDSSNQLQDTCDICGLVGGMRGVAVGMFTTSVGIAINFFLACLPKSWLPNQSINVWWMMVLLPILIILMITFIALGAVIPLDKGPLSDDQPLVGKKLNTRYVWHSAPFINLVISTVLLLVATQMTCLWKNEVLQEEGTDLVTSTPVTPVVMGNP